jgi:hypothetical protein
MQLYPLLVGATVEIDWERILKKFEGMIEPGQKIEKKNL